MGKEEDSDIEISPKDKKHGTTKIAEHFRFVKSAIRKDAAHHFEITYFSVRIVALVKLIALGRRYIAVKCKNKITAVSQIQL